MDPDPAKCSGSGWIRVRNAAYIYFQSWIFLGTFKILKNHISDNSISYSSFSEFEVKPSTTIEEDPEAITEEEAENVYASYIQAEYINYLTEKVCGSMNTDIHKCFIAFFFKLKLSNK